jgi:lipoprotein-releasing system permease protein
MYKLLLCIRYLRTRYIALACIISVMLGVATMIVVNSVMAGFTTEMRDRLHNFLADIVIESRGTGIEDANRQLATVEAAAGQYIAAMTPTIDIPGMITYTDPYGGGSTTLPVQIQGIDPAGKALVGPLQSYLDSYNPVIEDDKVIREPLRDANEPLSWNLTESAAEHRRFVKQRNSLYQQDQDFGLDSELLIVPPDNKTPAPEFDSGDASDSSAPTQAIADTAGDVPSEAQSTDVVPAESEPGKSELADASETAAASPHLIEDDFLSHPPASKSSEVNTAPLAARIFLGEGLVSFQAQNPETGKLQKIMIVEPGDDVILSTVTAGPRPEPVRISATVVDSFRSGMNEYDTSIVLMNINELQKSRGMHLDNSITSIHIRLKDYNDADKAIAALERAFPPGMVSIRTWEEKQGLLLSAVEVETAILNVLLFLIITVAGFGILAIFYMIVVEKTRDIGILKSLGASSNGVMSIFLSYGVGLGIVGSTAGVIIGLLFVRYINQIEDALSWVTGRKVFDEKIYYFPEIPTSISPLMVISVAFGAISIAVLASILPARRAARLHPVRALRFE